MLGEESDERVCQFIDKYIKCDSPQNDNDLHLLASSLPETFSYKNCQKERRFCRFHFPKPPVLYTIVVNYSKEEDKSTTLISNKPLEIAEEPNWREVFVTVQSTIQKISEQFPNIDLSHNNPCFPCNTRYIQRCPVQSTTRFSISINRKIVIWINSEAFGCTRRQR